jgi:hypothetical protein
MKLRNPGSQQRQSMRQSRVVRPDRAADLNGAPDMAATKDLSPSISSGRVIDARPIDGLPTEGGVNLDRPLGENYPDRGLRIQE